MQNTTRLKNTVLITLALMLLGVAAHVALDAAQFHRIVENEQATGACCSWYVQSWVNMPYTNFRLSSASARDYWTRDGVGTLVLVRDVQYEGAGFWTELRRGDSTGRGL